MRNVSTVLVILAAASAFAPAPVVAEQPATDTTAPFSVNARMNFRVVYPRFLFFRVGATGAAVANLAFAVPAAAVGDSNQVFATGGNTGVGGRALTVDVLGNNGQVTITATNSSAGLGLGTGVPADGFINYNQISTTSDSGALPAPTLTNAGGTISLPTLNTGLVTQRSATWTYAYLNTTVPSSGIYGGTPARGGVVTYTATMP